MHKSREEMFLGKFDKMVFGMGKKVEGTKDEVMGEMQLQLLKIKPIVK